MCPHLHPWTKRKHRLRESLIIVFLSLPVAEGGARLASSSPKAPREEVKRTRKVDDRSSSSHAAATGAEEAEAEASKWPRQVSAIPYLSIKVGGMFALFEDNWKTITSDAWVLQTIKGFQIEFYGSPHQEVRPRPLFFPSDQAALVDKEVSNLLRKGAIVPTTLHPHGFVSNLFVVDKTDGGQRPVINLKDFNQWLVYRHFKMEGIHLLRDLLQPNIWMVRLDLQDAYLSVPVFPPHRRFLLFIWKGKVFEFATLPFGLSSAPWCFTKVLKPVVETLRAKGLRLIVYLDDILLLEQCPLHLSQRLREAIDLLSHLGFVINERKSLLSPTRQITFLGFTIDSVGRTLSLPPKKILKIRREIKRTLARSSISLRQVARVVGLLSSSIQAIFPGPLHYRALQRLKATHLRRGLQYSDQVSLTQEVRRELSWWLDHMEAWNGRAIFGCDPDLVIESDASKSGWGARCWDSSSGGKWSADEGQLHINCLELMAGSFAIKCWTKEKVSCNVLLKMDNVSAVRYNNHLGGTNPRL